MREIKFRLISVSGKIIGYEKWYSGSLDSKNFWKAHPCWLYSKDGEYWNPKVIEHRHKDQFSSFKDKNGKDIFENDIVKFVYEHRKSETYEQKLTAISRVEFFNGNFIIPYAEQGNLSYWMQKGDIEIIGNIKENPQLLEKK